MFFASPLHVLWYVYFWSPIHYAYEIFLTSDAKSGTNWNQINQINRLTYFCLTIHEESLYRTPNYLMENQKQSKSIQYCSKLLYTFHGKKVFDDGDLHICTLLQQQHYCFTTRIHLKKKLMFDSLRRFIDSWSNFVSFFSWIKSVILEKIYFEAHFKYGIKFKRHVSLYNKKEILNNLECLISTRK